MLPRSKQVEKKDFNVDIELFRVGNYTFYGLVCHYISVRRGLHLVIEDKRHLRS